MSHIVGTVRNGTRVLEKPWAMVTVRATGRESLEVQPGILVAKADTIVTPLPDKIRVVGADGEDIRPSAGRSFWITVESFDPFYGLTELP